MDPEIARQAYHLGSDTRDWKVKLAQDDLKQSGLNRENIRQILYRPFDIRYTCYTGNSRGFHCMPRPEVMQNLLDPCNNLGLSLSKRVEGNKTWEHVFIFDKLITHHSVSMKEVNYVFPLYLIKHKQSKKSHFQTFILFDPETGYEGKIPNIDQRIHEKLCGVYQTTITPENILHYIYAILYSQIYREKYTGFLKIDFPRIPFPASREIFSKIAEYGNILVDLHLMKSRLLDKPVSRYQGESDDDRITIITYKEEEQRIYTNDDKYFDTIIPAVWNYRIGGYQVLSKCLKDRKNRILDDPRYFCRIITAIHETLRIRDLIDEIYEMAEREVIAF
jgi:predicted helicase